MPPCPELADEEAEERRDTGEGRSGRNELIPALLRVASSPRPSEEETGPQWAAEEAPARNTSKDSNLDVMEGIIFLKIFFSLVSLFTLKD